MSSPRSRVRATNTPRGPGPRAALSGVDAYAPPSRPAHVDLILDSNEGPRPPRAWLDAALVDPALAQRYPDARPLEALLAARVGVDAERVIVTAGGDDAIDRLCRAFLEPGRELLHTEPTFTMIPRGARLAGASAVGVPWDTGPFPLATMLGAIGPRTSVIAVVSPNNPTGAVASADDLCALSEAAPDAVLLVDLAYTEFADEDLTGAALALPNAVVVRTFSKAWGLAGLRVGWAAGPSGVIRALRAAGAPFAVPGPSLAAAARAMETGETEMRRSVDRVRAERRALTDRLRALGACPRASQANFVLADLDQAEWTWSALRSLGISVRRFERDPALARSLRITCPGDASAMFRLGAALEAALAPRALLFDMDGVLADVSGSYRAAIIQTCRVLGAEIQPGDIARAKAAGGANNDWALSRRLLAERGVDVPLDEVTRVFESLYQGEPGRPGLREMERLIPERALLERLRRRVPLAIVTGRPRTDAHRVLTAWELEPLFDAVVCMEDAPIKPDPAPALLTLERLGVASAWMIGDTPDDVVCARRAGVVPLGVVAPGDAGSSLARALEACGPARMLAALDDLDTLLEALS